MLVDRGLLSDWAWEPGVVLPLALTAAIYARGTRVLRRRTRRTPSAGALACFWSGLVIVALSLVSPLHEASEQLFSAHMIQHELLMTVGAPLLVLGRPGVVLLWGVPATARPRVARVLRAAPVRRAWRTLVRPLDAWLLHGVAIWAWHIPLLFQATLTSDTVHALQHLSFLGSALLFWWSLLFVQRREARGASIVYLFTTAVHTGVLGALMTFSRVVWYPAYGDRAAAWGLTPLADQQLAGLIMWIPASVAYLVAALLIVHLWLRESELAVVRGEHAVAAALGR
ncbi:MAG TPA: cytochrome c oxidase assembly protein [Gemmatimonadaceae bacterium]|nr:cytochrome c oxidase assembly protein [Gemmatimonadaceae bacterium]